MSNESCVLLMKLVKACELLRTTKKWFRIRIFTIHQMAFTSHKLFDIQFYLFPNICSLANKLLKLVLLKYLLWLFSVDCINTFSLPLCGNN